MSSNEIHMAVNRVRAEFSEMPGLRLSCRRRRVYGDSIRQIAVM